MKIPRCRIYGDEGFLYNIVDLEVAFISLQ